MSIFLPSSLLPEFYFGFKVLDSTYGTIYTYLCWIDLSLQYCSYVVLLNNFGYCIVLSLQYHSYSTLQNIFGSFSYSRMVYVVLKQQCTINSSISLLTSLFFLWGQYPPRFIYLSHKIVVHLSPTANIFCLVSRPYCWHLAFLFSLSLWTLASCHTFFLVSRLDRWSLATHSGLLPL